MGPPPRTPWRHLDLYWNLRDRSGTIADHGESRDSAGQHCAYERAGRCGTWAALRPKSPQRKRLAYPGAVEVKCNSQLTVLNRHQKKNAALRGRSPFTTTTANVAEELRLRPSAIHRLRRERMEPATLRSRQQHESGRPEPSLKAEAFIEVENSDPHPPHPEGARRYLVSAGSAAECRPPPVTRPNCQAAPDGGGLEALLH